MKIVVFGANSPTAQLLINQLSLIPKCEVFGLIRSEYVELYKHPEVKYIQYSLSKLEKVREYLLNADVWISFIGASNLLKARKTKSLYYDSASAILSESGISTPQRIIWISSSGVIANPNDGFFFKRILKPFFLSSMYHDMRNMEELILESKVTYTIIRPPYLTKSKKIEKIRVQEDFFLDDNTLSRRSLALFILNEILNAKWINKIVAITT
ncbi:MAG: hypothetical protein RLZZ357_840 [Bacteroidota bacterium]|jgi:hypothetical protein